MLSNNHVLANENNANPGDAILQPGPYDNGQNPSDRIGTLVQFVPLSFPGPNTVDCAVGALDSTIQFDSRNLDSIGQLSGVRPNALDVGEAVAKIGRTTGVTRGTVTAIEVDNITITYDNGDITFNGQIEIQGADGAFSQGGDSGALIVDQNNQAVGLLFAGSDSGADGKPLTYANPIQEVLGALSIDIII